MFHGPFFPGLSAEVLCYEYQSLLCLPVRAQAQEDQKKPVAAAKSSSFLARLTKPLITSMMELMKGNTALTKVTPPLCDSSKRLVNAASGRWFRSWGVPRNINTLLFVGSSVRTKFALRAHHGSQQSHLSDQIPHEELHSHTSTHPLLVVRWN